MLWALDGFGLAIFTARGNRDVTVFMGEPGDGPAFPNLGPGGAGVFEKKVVEGGAFDLKGGGFAGETAVAENEFERFARIAKMELRAELFREPGSFEQGQHAHFLEDAPVVREEGFADVEAGKVFLFKEEDVFAGASEESSGGAATGPAANY